MNNNKLRWGMFLGGIGAIIWWTVVALVTHDLNLLAWVWIGLQQAPYQTA